MASVAYGLRDNARRATRATTRTGTAQLVLYLRAGYYVQWYNAATVGAYGADAARRRSAPGWTASSPTRAPATSATPTARSLSEAVTLIDSAEQNARYLYVVKRLLTGYNSSYDASWWMLNAVNNVYTVLFRGPPGAGVRQPRCRPTRACWTRCTPSPPATSSLLGTRPELPGLQRRPRTRPVPAAHRAAGHRCGRW